MSPHEVLSELKRHGFEVRCEGDRLQVRPSLKFAPAELAAAARARKAELLDLLRQPEPKEALGHNVASEVRAEIARIEPAALAVGWLPARLWNSVFWPAPRGLAAVLDGSDRIVEVTREWILIRKADGNQQRFFRCDG